jgi:phosphatidylinositol alpha-1,6-mannosyltransferase
VVQLPVGVDVERFRPDVSAAEVRERHYLGSGPIISAVSRLVPRKGHDQVIRALPEIRRAFPAVRFLVVGAGRDEARLRALATHHEVDAHVVFAGAVRCDDLPAYFRAGDVFAMPCRHRWAGLDVEAFGSVYLQAAAVGRATVAGRAGGVPEAVEHGQTGLVVDGTHVGEVAAAVLSLLRDPERAAAMGERGAARVRADFTWDLMAARLRGLLEDVLSRARVERVSGI